MTLEAWPFGTDLQQKPLYTLTQTGTDGRTVHPDLFVTDRRIEEIQWWSVHKLGNGQHLFDTYVPVFSFSISREVLTTRYAGLEVPPDDAKDTRLKEPHVVGVITYASADGVIREALLTSDDPKQAKLLRSYFGSTWTLKLVEGATGAGRGKASEPPRSLKLSLSQNYPSPPGTIEVTIPIAGDDLDLTRTILPPRLHVLPGNASHPALTLKDHEKAPLDPPCWIIGRVRQPDALCRQDGWHDDSDGQTSL